MKVKTFIPKKASIIFSGNVEFRCLQITVPYYITSIQSNIPECNLPFCFWTAAAQADLLVILEKPQPQPQPMYITGYNLLGLAIHVPQPLGVCKASKKIADWNMEYHTNLLMAIIASQSRLKYLDTEISALFILGKVLLWGHYTIGPESEAQG